MAADKPDAGFEISDEMFDAILAEDETAEAPTRTADPAPTQTDPTGDTPAGNSEAAADGNSEGGEDRDVETGEQPAPPPPTGDAPAALAPTIPGAKPFQFKASGTLHELPGAVELPDGNVLVQKDALAEFRKRLASGQELSAEFKRTQREYDRKLTAIKAERTSKDVEADAVLALLADVTKMTPEQRWEWAQKFDEERPKLELEIQRQQLERERQALIAERNGPQLSPEEQVEQVQGVLTSELNATFRRLVALPEAKLFSREELTELYQKWEKRTDRLTRQADRDDPALGVKKGDWLFDDDDVVRDFKFMLGVKQKAGATSPAAARNAAMNGDASPIPPAVRGGRIPAAPAKKKAKVFDREAFMRGEEDDE